MSKIAVSQKTKDEKIENMQWHRTDPVLNAYVECLKKSPPNEKMKGLSTGAMRKYLVSKLIEYKKLVDEINQIHVPWYSRLLHIKGVDPRQADKRATLVSTIENDGFDLYKVENLLSYKYYPKPYKRFHI